MVTEINLNNYVIEKKEKFFVDTNVLIFIFSPYTRNPKNYDKFFEDSLDKECKLFTTSQNISEFVNVFLKASHKIYNEEIGRNVHYKRMYRNTSHYKESFKWACEIVEQEILPRVTILPIGYKHVKKSIENYINLLDYNDALYTHIIKSDMKLVSDDRDFSNSPKDFVWLFY